MAIGAFPSSLLHYKTHRSTLIQQPQLPIFALLIPRVPVDPAVEQSPVEISDQAPDVASGVGLPGGAGVLEVVDVLLELIVPQLVVALVEGVDLSRFGYLHFLGGEDELSEHGVQREGVDAFPDCEDEDYGARVHAVAGGEEVAAWLAHVHHAPLLDRAQLPVIGGLTI